MKYSQCGGSSEDLKNETDLQSALDAMLAVLRCVNDSMHQVAITGYQVFNFDAPIPDIIWSNFLVFKQSLYCILQHHQHTIALCSVIQCWNVFFVTEIQ